MKKTILSVDDEPKVHDSFDLIFEDKYNLLTASSAEEAYQILAKEPVDLVFLDIAMPGEDGLSCLEKLRQGEDPVDVVMVTGNRDAKMAIQAMKLGAKDYVVKPFEVDEILLITERILEGKQLLKEVKYLREAVSKSFKNNPIIGESKGIKSIFEIVRKVCDNDSTVLLQGESGTGKELIARAIHFTGQYKLRPFVPVNCGAIPDNLVESELFGHEKGSFTGATQKKIGKFELANQGTIFLDEVGNLKLDTQAKLLRVLQEQEVERVGGGFPIPVEVRVISATNIDLKKAVDDGRFREDLYYRLNVVQIQLPPLRDRKEDVELLVDHYLKYYAARFKKEITGITKEAIEYLCQYDWPGNIRELRNIIERVVALTNKTIIDFKELPLDLLIETNQRNSSGVISKLSLKDARDSFETQYITSVLKTTGWNQSRSADILGVHRNTLINKMNELNIRPEPEENK